jgi:hypothetical protein
MEARMQLREVMDNMLADAVGTASVANAVGTAGIATQPAAQSRTQSHVSMPGRGLVSIQQLVAQLNRLAPGVKPSADRLTRIAQHTPRGSSGQSCNVLEVSLRDEYVRCALL